MQPFARNPVPALVGVVHLLPLPGAPAGSPGPDAVVERARADADALARGGADAVMVENFGDAPFAADRVDAATVAMMTRVALAVRDIAPTLPIGINVLRNDARAALAVAAVVGAAFIRVNVHVGTMVTDQGPITGDARGTLLERNRLGARVAVAADVLVKHAVPLGDWTLEDAARDTHHRGRADALIITGRGTGLPIADDDLDRARAAVPDAVVWVGSGTTPERAAALRGRADAAIVGTWLHEGADLSRPIDRHRVRAMREALQG